ncbi:MULTISPECIES: hypothetical protein [Sphingobacterium]|uniref:hypothetical protein n=1 Tax=Sphingobacterium TaxID=28453 RepID=UPI0028A5954B|nr:hypothetical protein [Sphingobacterium multivorum]
MQQKRLNRLKYFEDFQNAEDNFFEQKKANLGKYQKFHDYNTLCVCPKGRNGGLSKRLYEVFYGARIYDSEMQVRSNLSTENKILSERGCTLAISLNDHGYVAVILHPAKTDYTEQIESCIFIENYLHPKKLSNPRYLETLWRFFNSYMEKTSIDGNPTLMDKWRVWYLRNFKNKVVNKKFLPIPFYSGLLSLGKYILTVGLSGFIIYVFTILPWRNSEDDKNKIDLDKLRIENAALKAEKQYLNTIDSLKSLIPKK